MRPAPGFADYRTPGPRPVLRQLGHARGRRSLRHPRLAGRPRGDRGPEGGPARRSAPQDHPAVMTNHQDPERNVPPTPAAQAAVASARPHPAHPSRPADPGRQPAQPSPAAVPHGARPPTPSPLGSMLEARSVALVGASARTGTFGQRMIEEMAKSSARPDIYLVNPRYQEIGGRRCHPSLTDLPGPVDLVLLAVPDAAVEQQLTLAARRGDRSAVIFGNAHEDRADGRPPLRGRLAAIARSADMQMCGAGCMGFVNVARGLRAIGYTEPDGLRERGPRAARDRLHRARPPARRPGRPSHPLRLGVLHDAARPPRDRLHARGLLRPGTGYRGRVLP